MLREARQKLGLTQKELADNLGFDSVQFVSNLEREVAPIPGKHFKRLSRVLKIPTKTLIQYNVERYRARLKREMNKGK